MEDITPLLDYFRKLQRTIDVPELRLFKYCFVKKSRIDDLLVCTLSLLPDSFKKAMSKRLNIDVYPAVSSYNRLSKIIKKPFFLNPEWYIIDYAETTTMLKNIKKHLERDLKKLEQE